MKQINYSAYSLEELLEVKAHIDPDSPNFAALMDELGVREDEIEARRNTIENEEFLIAEKRVKIVGYFQLAAAVAISVYWIVSLFNDTATWLSSVVAVSMFILNLVAGYTALKEMNEKYWISMLNQALQIPNVAIGSVQAAYSGLGGAYVYVSWIDSPEFGLSASFSPGVSFVQYTGSLNEQFVAIDFIAIIFIIALITMTERRSTPDTTAFEKTTDNQAD